MVMTSASGGCRGCDLDCQLEARLFNKPLERQANELRLAVAEGTRKLCGSPEAKGFPPFLDIAEMGSGDTQLTGEFGLGRFFTEADREQEITQGQRPPLTLSRKRLVELLSLVVMLADLFHAH